VLSERAAARWDIAPYLFRVYPCHPWLKIFARNRLDSILDSGF